MAATKLEARNSKSEINPNGENSNGQNKFKSLSSRRDAENAEFNVRFVFENIDCSSFSL
jgi:hypothetical protein